ncbi:hypothetical protein BDV40DRAFT_35623 [Aspergillus tamarii]|uniref:Uncharacterized protein n=1 Tax=Aspergillus tamarii TaxID=41984 RepID=A0A5N6UH81_ASPTM|nr:hypothetical protein BDV40DRAFT_35623 [Aspergillus tamarii]
MVMPMYKSPPFRSQTTCSFLFAYLFGVPLPPVCQTLSKSAFLNLTTASLCVSNSPSRPFRLYLCLLCVSAFAERLSNHCRGSRGRQQSSQWQ